MTMRERKRIESKVSRKNEQTH